MGLKHASQSGVDWVDIAQAMTAFEIGEKCSIRVIISTCGTRDNPKLSLQAVQTFDALETGEVPRSVLQNATCSATSNRTLEAAILALLYQLDFQSALEDYISEEGKKA